MPLFSSRFRAARTLVAVAASVVMAQGVVAQEAGSKPVLLAKVDNSNIDAPLFYQLLIGEMQLREGEAGAAFQVILDAARRTKNEQLFRRATDIALQARAGDQALVSAKAWRQTLPDSLDALRYQVQLLVALNRPQETLEPLQALLKQTPAAERSSLITALPRFFARSTDKAQVATLTEEVLRPYIDAPDTRVASLVTSGRSWLAAQDNAKALAFAQRVHTLDPAAEGPAVLALELPPGDAGAAAIVQGHLAARPDSNGVRLLYVRGLLAVPRYADATAQLEILTRTAPQLAQAWLTLGALHLQLREPAPAIVALQKYVELVQAGGAVPKPAADAAEDDDVPASKEDALTRAWLLLAQAADLQGDFRAAEAWLAKIDDPQRALEVQTRRASLLARQGKLAQARELIRRVPEKAPADARAKLLAEAQVLRDVKQWGEANTLLAKANVQFTDDVDLIYEQSMMLEKLNKLDEMERLLRRVIAIKPDHQHAYNALGYSLAERNVRLPEARTLIKKALDLSPGEPSITDSLGWVEYRLGNREEAVRLLRDAYRGQPDAEIAAHLGEVLWVSGQKDEARKIWREGRGKDAGNEVLRETLARLRVDL
ncbi:MAG: tetratricopeptide repeat protein [Burkholderiales bacterium]|nr:tetratricopeptide repeat protein [Burkholderiales bacterium]